MRIRCLEIVSGLGMGGAEKTLVDRLLWAPHDFETKIVDTIPNLLNWELPSGITYVECPRKKLNYLKVLRFQIESSNPDVLVVRTPVDLIVVATIKKLASHKWKLVYEAHSTKISQNTFFASILKPLQRLAIGSSDLVVAVSKSVAEGEQCRGAKKIVIHYFGANTQMRNHDQKEKISFLFVGRFIPLKQPLLLLEAVRDAFSILQDAGAMISFVGKGPLETEIREYIELNNLQEVVRVVGYVSNLEPLYSSSDFLISTSRFEGLPITFFEAKQHGLRIITTPSSGDFDILGVEDQILANFEKANLADALGKAAQGRKLTPEERSSIQIKNRWMSAEKCAQKYYQLIEEQLSQTA